jgi:uracil-DNA glycosylase
VAGARVILIGQAPGPKEVVEKRPFAFTAGRTLFRWLLSIGIGEDEFRRRVHIAAVIRCFPGKDASGGDRVPDPEEIARCGEHLDREIAILKPRLVIAVGTLAAAQFVPPAPLKDLVGVQRKVRRAGRRFDLVILPHPSGRSTWTQKKENAELLQKSLGLIAAHPSFRQSVLREKRT